MDDLEIKDAKALWATAEREAWVAQRKMTRVRGMRVKLIVRRSELGVVRRDRSGEIQCE